MDRSLSDNPIYRHAAILLLFAAVVVVLAKSVVSLEPLPAVAAVIAMSVIVLCLFYIELAASALLVMMIFSPEISLGSLPSRDIAIRFDDVILAILCIAWILRVISNRRLRLIKLTPLNVPIAMFVITAIFATLNGLTNGNVKGTESLLYLIKYIEYYLVFFLFMNILDDERRLNRFLNVFIATAVAACIWGIYRVIAGDARISLPFEGPKGEANTFGGYLLLILGLALFMAFEARSLATKLISALFAIAAFVLILYTYSRASYLGLFAMAGMIVYFAGPVKKIMIALAVIVLLSMGPSLIPQSVLDRVQLSFRGETVEVAPDINLSKSDSSYLKYESAMRVLEYWKQSPFIGVGITGVGLVDTQYPRILGETGLIGCAFFFWIIISIYYVISRARRAVDALPAAVAWKWRAVIMGYLCGLAGVLAHAVGANTFIIIRIMEPFWFLAAVVTAIPNILHKSAREYNAPDAETPAASSGS